MEKREVMSMIKKFIVVLLMLAILAALMPGSLAASGSHKDYRGFVGADSPFYPLKISLQKLDVFMTLNKTDKLAKQLNMVNERLNDTEVAAFNEDSEAFNKASDALISGWDDINGTLQYYDEDSGVLMELYPTLLHHQEVFYGLADNNTTPLTIQNRMVLINGEFIKIKNGMPFYYYNDTAYFIPPGQRKNMENGIINGSKVPPGLAKKGYETPSPTVANGSKVWPWDQVPYPTTIKKNNGNGNGKGNGNGNGN
jgi:hypothetical protein